jgi:hypothetical protein
LLYKVNTLYMYIQYTRRRELIGRLLYTINTLYMSIHIRIKQFQWYIKLWSVKHTCDEVTCYCSTISRRGSILLSQLSVILLHIVFDDCCIHSIHCTCIYNTPDGENLLDDCCIKSIHCTCIYNTPDGENLLDDCNCGR